MSDNYSKREIDLMLQRMTENHEIFDKKLDAILEQAKKTNGRVKTLEMWRAWITGAVAVISPIVGFLVYELIKVGIK